MSNPSPDNYFVTDAPLSFADDDDRPDLLEREQFAEQVALRISMAGRGDSVVFGLEGPWGAGKTSTLAQIKHALIRRCEEGTCEGEWKIVEFTPWSASNELDLTEEFYSTIASALDDPGEKRDFLRRVSNAALPVVAAVAGKVASGIADRLLGKGTTDEAVQAGAEAGAEALGEFRFEEDPFAKRFTGISDFLQSTGLQILVLVDDVDRLHHDELLAVMKAVRLLGRFKGVHYLLSYDTQTVTDVLSRTDLAGGDHRRASQYLEKIVQYPFQLPPIQEVHIAKIIDARLRTLIEQYGFEPRRYYLDHLMTWLPLHRITLRLVYRIFAQVDMMLTLVSGEQPTSAHHEIDLIDAILVTYLRLEYPSLYRLLPRWKDDLLGHTLKRVEESKREEWREELRKRILTTVDPENRRPDEHTDVLSVMRALFPAPLHSLRDAYRRVPDDAPRQIRDETYFGRYFTHGFPAQDIRNAQLHTELDQLLTTGALPDNSLIRSSGDTGADDDVRRRLLHTRIRETLMPLLSEPPTPWCHFGDAAITLTSLTSEEERNTPDRSDWWVQVVLLLWDALAEKQGSDTTQKAVLDYIEKYGLQTAGSIVSLAYLDSDSPLWALTRLRENPQLCSTKIPTRERCSL